MADPRAALGLHGEEAAARHLQTLGWTILARRHRTRLGELDLVADDGSAVVFVEVKTRRGDGAGSPEESVSAPKQRRLARLAGAFLQSMNLNSRDCRFDVIGVRIGKDGNPEIRHIRDAFRA